MSGRGRHRPFYLAAGAAALSCVSALWASPLLALVAAAVNAAVTLGN